jgi:hypothetical protein
LKEGKLDLEKGNTGKTKVAAQPIHVDSEVARIKKQMHQIQASTIARERKIQQQQRLIADEIARVEKQMRENDADESNDPKGKGAARDRRKAGMDNLQKLLEILRSMSVDIQ